MSSKKTIEGLEGLKNVEEIRKKHNLNMPITKNLYEVVFDNKKIKDFIKELWSSFPEFEF